MKIIFNRKLLFVLLISLLSLFICNINVYATDTSFTLTQETMDVTLNGSRFISYTGGTGLVTWESSDESIATVENGTVRGHQIGTATITATRGEETATCKVNVVYSFLKIGGNSYNSITNVNLVLNEHDSEDLYATVEDSNFEVVDDAIVTWSSSNTNIVTVNENTGTITAVKEGKATITASAAGVSDSCEVTVVNGPKFTNFSNAKYELLYDIDVDLKITDIAPNDENHYYYIITSNNTKPTLSKTSYGALDTDIVTDAKYLNVNTEENYIYARNLDKYVELNQDLYLWVIEEVKLDAAYAINEENTYISHSTKFVVEGKKLTRPELPQLNLILKSLTIWGGENSSNTEEFSSINFRFPTAVENRKFKLKIGKVTDNSILQKIKNNDYSGITELLTYAKNNKAVYTADLTTTRENYYSNDKALFDGVSLLQDRAYYYIYVEFDDEDGKYYPIEGVTLGQALISSSGKYWDLYAYTADNFEWNDLSSTPTEPDDDKVTDEKEDPDDNKVTDEKEDPDDNKVTDEKEESNNNKVTDEKEKTDDSVSKDKLPNTGSKALVVLSVITIVSVTCIICYKKYNFLRDIN